MISTKRIFSKLAVSLLLAAGALAATCGVATARMVCNGEGDCWHTDDRATYPGTGYAYHNDDWYFHQHWDGDRDHHYRGYHEGRGYYKGGVWITL